MERQQDHLCQLRLHGLLLCHKRALRRLHKGQPQHGLQTLRGGALPPVLRRRRPDRNRRLQSLRTTWLRRDPPLPTSPRWSSSYAWKIGVSRTSLQRGRSRWKSFGMTYVFCGKSWVLRWSICLRLRVTRTSIRSHFLRKVIIIGLVRALVLIESFRFRSI